MKKKKKKISKLAVPDANFGDKSRVKRMRLHIRALSPYTFVGKQALPSQNVLFGTRIILNEQTTQGDYLISSLLAA